MKLETRSQENKTISTFGLNGNLKYPETTSKICKACNYCENSSLKNDREVRLQTSPDLAHAQTLFSSVYSAIFG